MAKTTQSAWITALSTLFPDAGTPRITASELRESLTNLAHSTQWIGDEPRAPGVIMVTNQTTTTPPGSPADDDTYIVGSGASGAWASQDGKIAVWDANVSPAAWTFYTPTDGWIVWDLANDALYRYDTGISPDAWVALSTGADPDTLLADTTDELQVGYSHNDYNAGTKSSGTYTPDEANGAMQYFVNGGAFTLAPPTNNTSLLLQMTNNASAGAVTTSSFTIVTGDSLTTTDGDDFLLYISKINGFSHLHVVALQ